MSSVTLAFMTANLDSNDEHGFDTNQDLKQWVINDLRRANYLFVGFQEDPDTTTSLSEIKTLLNKTNFTYRQVRQRPVQWFLSAIGYNWIDGLIWLLDKWKTPNLYFFSNNNSRQGNVKKFKCRWTCGFHFKSHFKGANIMAFMEPNLNKYIIVVNTHLYYAGYKKGVIQRYQQFIEILRYLADTFIPQEFDDDVKLSDCILVVMGDLNFRFIRKDFGLTDRRYRNPITPSHSYDKYFEAPKQLQKKDGFPVLRGNQPGTTYQVNNDKRKDYQLSILLEETLRGKGQTHKSFDNTTKAAVEHIKNILNDDIRTVLERIRTRIAHDDMFITCRYNDTRKNFHQIPNYHNMSSLLSLQKNGKARDPAPCDQILIVGPDDTMIKIRSTVMGMNRSDHLIRVAVAEIHTGGHYFSL